MNPSSLDEFKRRLKEEIVAPYIQQIQMLQDRLRELEDEVNRLRNELTEKDTYINELEEHIEKLSAGERITKPVMHKGHRDEEDVVTFILGR